MDLTQAQRDLLHQHLRLVLEENQYTNITSITSFEEGLLLHVQDSLAGLPEVESAPDGPMVDIGSGAGFPGIPLAVATGKKVTLVESVGKKADVLRRMVDRLGLAETAEVYAGRSEELAREGRTFAVVTARALSTLPSLLELASPLLQHGGHLVAYKSLDIAEELEAAQAIQEKLGMKYCESRSFDLASGIGRSIVVFEKTSEPTVKLPRRPGMAQSRPYR